MAPTESNSLLNPASKRKAAYLPKPTTMTTTTNNPSHRSRIPTWFITLREAWKDEASRDYMTGIVLLLCVVSLWVISSFITSDLFAGGFNKPFLVTYMNTSAFTLYLLPFLFKRRFFPPMAPLSPPSSPIYHPAPRSRTRSLSARRSMSLDGRRSLSPMATLHPPLAHSSVCISAEVNGGEGIDRLSVRETAGLAVLFCGAWFAANWSVNKSLEWTSVGSSTILASMSGFFTLGIGRLFRVETFTLSKMIAVTISFMGVLLVSLADTLSSTARPALPSSAPSSSTPDNFTSNASWIVSSSPHTYRMYGDALALLSAFFYAMYVVLLKVRIGEEARVDMQLFFGFVGLFNTLLLWPVGLVLHFTGWETLEIPSGEIAWLTMAANMCITLISDYLYVIAMLKTTPLVVTIGLSLTIPFALIGDYFRGTSTGGWQAIMGAVLVLLSFSFMGVEGAKEVELDEQFMEEYEEDQDERSPFLSSPSRSPSPSRSSFPPPSSSAARMSSVPVRPSSSSMTRGGPDRERGTGGKRGRERRASDRAGYFVN
ncbi:Predicted membrane protein [Phaffia rhodozyma]|uniref:Predicted membrane protein n=1 Tax=Phaffia rhodozyma TaxID=264483 RepID=A0A0F7SXF8_PHARH|nr:Predicted membrane protein [Phaffia rhodozyma]